MRWRIFTALLGAILMANMPARADEDARAQARLFLASISPPGAKISFASAEPSGDAITVRDVVAHAETPGGEEIIQRIGLLRLQGLKPLPSGLFRVEKLSVENIRIDAAGVQTTKPGGIQIEKISASDIDGARLGDIAATAIEISTFAIGSTYAIRIAGANLKNVNAQSLTRALVRANDAPEAGRREDAALHALLNDVAYDALHLHGLSLRRDKTSLITVAEISSTPDGAYAPFPASGKFSIRQADIDLLDPMAAMLYRQFGQDRLQFSLESQHSYRTPASHGWDISLKLSPDAVLAGKCAAQNLNGFSPALIRQNQAASGSAGILRSCDLNFTGTGFVNRWLAQDGARDGLSLEEARAKYLAGSLLVSLDPAAASDPLAQQLSGAAQIFLTQPARVNIRIEPQGGLKFPDGAATLAMLFQGRPEQRREAMQKLGLSIAAQPLD